MFLSRDLLLNGSHPTHLSVLPSLGLIIINDLQDFAGNWTEARITTESSFKKDINIRTLYGYQYVDEIAGAARYFVEMLTAEVTERNFAFIGPTSKITFNINLARDILTDRRLIQAIGSELVDLLRSGNPGSSDTN